MRHADLPRIAIFAVCPECPNQRIEMIDWERYVFRCSAQREHEHPPRWRYDDDHPGARR